MRPAAERRRAGDDALDARDLGGNDRHVRGGDHRVAPARHVAADRIHRDMLVAEDDAGQRLDLDILHAGALRLGKAAHLRLRETDVLEIALRHLCDRLLDLGRREAETRRRPVVEFLAQIADGIVAARFHAVEDALDGLAHLGVGLFDRARVHAAFEIVGHRGSLLSAARRARTKFRHGPLHAGDPRLSD